MSTVLLTRDASVATLRLNRPEAMNALSPELLDELIAALRACLADPPSVLVVEGAGRAFSAGVDLKVLQAATPTHGRLAGAYAGQDEEVIHLLRGLPCPVIAKVHGACFTGALELALHCDVIYTTADTRFGDTHAKFGIRPSWGMSQNLPVAVGMRRAKELSYTARTFTGADAAGWGLANEAVADKAALDALVAKRAAQIAANSRATVAAIKDLHRVAEAMPLEAGLAEEVARDYPDIQDTEARLAQFKRR
ncbi:MAG: enoyl-CoA hydratase [Deltaproteobacteria bacterium]|nr:enoyl-CoA hydratase [Deltaproteobacteria bacterium]